MRIPEGIVRKHRLYGANFRLARWAESSALLGIALPDEKRRNDWIDNLCKAWSSAADATSSLSQRLINELWTAQRGLGPYPLAGTALLSRFEFDRVFYPNYRDHVSHQLRVFLLGLYTIELVSPLRIDLQREVGGNETESLREVVRRWIVTATFHDIGYILECNPESPGNQTAWKHIENAATKHCSALLAGIIPRATEQVLISRGAPTAQMPDIQAFASDSNGWFADLDREAQACGLSGPGAETLRSYLALTRSRPFSEGRPTYFDHGIGSAALLLWFWTAFSTRLEFALAQVNGKLPHQPLLRYAEDLRRVQSAAESCAPTVRRAAAAMALHNINKEWPESSKTGAAWDELTLDDFWIARRRGDSSSELCTPLAFLLAVVDTLQDWDRPRFRAPEEEDKRMVSQDMSVRIADDKLLLYFPSDAEHLKNPSSAPYGVYSSALRALKAYIKKEEVDALIGWDTTPYEGLEDHTPIAEDQCSLVSRFEMEERKVRAIRAAERADSSDLFYLLTSSNAPSSKQKEIEQFVRTHIRNDVTMTSPAAPPIRLEAIYQVIGFWDILALLRIDTNRYKTFEDDIKAHLKAHHLHTDNDPWLLLNVTAEHDSLKALHESFQSTTETGIVPPVPRRRLRDTRGYESFRSQRAFISIHWPDGRKDAGNKALAELTSVAAGSIVEAVSKCAEHTVLELFMKCSETSLVNAMNRWIEAKFANFGGKGISKYTLSVYDYFEYDDLGVPLKSNSCSASTASDT